MSMTQSMDMNETECNYVDVGSVSYETNIQRFRSFDEYMDVSSASDTSDNETDVVEDVLLENKYNPVILAEIGDMDIETYRFILEKRFISAQERYKGLEEYMEIPDMDVWLRLKKEIIENKVFDYMDEFISNPWIDEEEYFDNFKNEDADYEMDDDDRAERFQDRWLCGRHSDRY